MNGTSGSQISSKQTLLYRTLLALVMIAVAAALRVAPHPWNFTPIGAIALFSGAVLKDRRLAFLFPMLALFVGDIFVGLYKFMPVVYASFLLNVAIGLWLRDRRTIGRISLGTFAGALQFYVVVDLGVWAFMGTYPLTWAGLIACYVAAIPFLWNMLASDALYGALLFGGYALAERFLPAFRASETPAAD